MQHPAFGNLPVNPIHRTMQMSALPFSVNPMVDFMTMMYAGDRLSARPQPGTTQGLYDAYFLRQQTMQMRAAQAQAMATSMPLARLGGINTQSPVFQMMAGLAGDPNGPVANFVSPWIGGNPMKAHMGYLANLNTQAMTTFGRTGSITLPETSRMMHELNRFAYNHKAIGTADLRTNQADILRTAANHGGIMRDQLSGLFVGSEGKINQASYDNLHRGYSNAARLNSELAEADTPRKIDAIKKAFVEGLTDQKSKTALEQVFRDGAGKSGKQLSEEAEKVLQIKTMNNLLGGTVASHITDQNNLGIMRPTGINYRNTMGLNLEDFSGAFTKLATTKLFGKGTSHSDFLAARPADMIDAAKGLFGNQLSGGEAMEQLSDLLGVSGANLGDATESSKLSNSMRDLKALGRNADIAVEAMVGLVRDANRIASQTDGLKYLGGKENIQLVDSVVRRATGLAGASSNDYVRRQGGMPGLVAGQMDAALSAMSQPISRQVAALAYQHQGNARAQALIQQFMNSDGIHNAGGFQQLIGGLSRVTGMATSQLLQSSTNTTAQNLGMRLNPAGFQKLGESAIADRFTRDLNILGHMSGAGRGYGDRLINHLAAKGQIDPDDLLANRIISQSPQLMHFVETHKHVLANGLMQKSPAGQRILADLAATTKADRTVETLINSHYGHLNAPAGQAILNQLFTSGPDSKFTELFSPLVDAPGLANLRDVVANSAAIHGATTLQQVIGRASFYKDDGKLMGVDDSQKLKDELGSYANSDNTVSKLARAGNMSESELLEKMGKFEDIKNADGTILVSAEKQRDDYVAGLAGNVAGGITDARLTSFKGMDHKAKAAALRQMGLAGVDLSKLDAVKGGLMSNHRRVVAGVATAPDFKQVDDRLLAGVKGLKGFGALEQAAAQLGATKGSKTLNIDDIINGNFDPASENGKKMLEARNQFLKEHIGDKRADEDDAAYLARGMKNNQVSQFATRTHNLAKQAGTIKGAMADAVGGGADSLPTSMAKLTGLMEKIPKLMENLTAAIQQATTP